MKFNRIRTFSGGLIALALLVPLGATPVAAATGYSPASGVFGKVNVRPIDTTQSKLDSHLAALAAQHATGTPNPAPRAQSLSVAETNVRVVVQATSPSNRAAARNAITTAGGRVEYDYADLVQAVVPSPALTSLAHSTDVRSVREPAHFVKESVATDEGVVSTEANQWHGDGVSGEGVKIAVFDIGFADLAAEQAAGALPSSLASVDDCPGLVTGTTDFNSDSHGTAVAEIVHAMAPQAQLTLICVNSNVELGVAEQYAVANGIQIVNFSVGVYGTSRGDGNGPAGSPEAIVADARAHGILWVNAAGNAAEHHWGGIMTPDSGGFNLFSGSDDGNQLTIPPGEQVCVTIKWDAWTGASYPMTASLVDPVAKLLMDQTAGGINGAPPVATVCAQNTTNTSRTFVLGVFDGIPGGPTNFGVFPKPRVDVLVESEDSQVVLQYTTANGSIMEPATSPSALSVGATCWQDNSLQPYSSRGPTIDGRIKPDIAAPDATSSDLIGPSSGCIGGFAGTSASAPHVAGAAALVMQALKTSSPDQVTQFLESNASRVVPGGPDNLLGAGVLRLPVGPPTPTVVFDGTRQGVEQRFTPAGTLTANWVVAFLAQGYQVAFGTSPGASDTVGFTNVGNTFSFTTTGLPLTDGAKYYATVRAVYAMGVLGPAGTSAGVTVDATRPTVALVSPTNNTNTSSRALTATASDSGSGVASVQFQRTLDGGATWLNIDAALTAPSFGNEYTLQASTGGLPDGTETIRAQATDGAGNVSASPQVSFALNAAGSSGGNHSGGSNGGNNGGGKSPGPAVTIQQTGGAGAGGSSSAPPVIAPVISAPAVVTTSDQVVPNVQPAAAAAPADVSVAGASTPSIALNPVTLSASIDGTQGGTLASDDGSIQLQVPAGVSSDTSLTVSLFDATGPGAPPVNLSIGSLLVNLVVQDSAGNTLTAFDPPLALTVMPLVSDGDPTALQVTALDPTSNTFLAVPFTLNADGTLTVSVATVGIAPTAAPVSSDQATDATDSPSELGTTE